jgi:hypothetical protein
MQGFSLGGRRSARTEPASVGDIYYALEGLVPWVDGDGVVHDGGWPACLRVRQTMTVRFGGLLVALPDAFTEYRVAYVDCRPVR